MEGPSVFGDALGRRDLIVESHCVPDRLTTHSAVDVHTSVADGRGIAMALAHSIRTAGGSLGLSLEHRTAAVITISLLNELLVWFT
jgi:hypothetical protein